MRCKTIRLNSAIENSKLVEWTVIRPSAGNSREQFAIGKARCRGMHTMSIYCDRRWFCRPPVMWLPWRRRSKKDPGFSSCGVLLVVVVVCFAFCRSSSQEMGRRFLRHRHTWIPHRDSSRLSDLPAAARLRRERNASTVLEIHSASALSDIPR